MREDGEGMWKLFEKSFHTFKNFSGKRFLCPHDTVGTGVLDCPQAV